MTSKIRFVDVLTAVRDYAFATSEYPIIISVENHCSRDQQAVCALYLVAAGYGQCEVYGNLPCVCASLSFHAFHLCTVFASASFHSFHLCTAVVYNQAPPLA